MRKNSFGRPGKGDGFPPSVLKVFKNKGSFFAEDLTLEVRIAKKAVKSPKRLQLHPPDAESLRPLRLSLTLRRALLKIHGLKDHVSPRERIKGVRWEVMMLGTRAQE